MGNNSRRAFETQLNQEENAFTNDVLSGYSKARYPERIDWVGKQIATSGSYTVGINSNNTVSLESGNFGDAIKKPYLDGLKELTGNTSYGNALPRNYPLGNLVIEFADLVSALEEAPEEQPEDVVDNDLEPGEVLGRLIVREIKRSATDKQARLAQSLHTETSTPRELVEQLCSFPELADLTQELIPKGDEANQLVRRLGAVKLSTELWDHQHEALYKWLQNDGNGYANMATATGKTVLGLAAIAYVLRDPENAALSNGALHPQDEVKLKGKFENELPQPGQGRTSNVLIVTTDTLLGAQWGRLFQEHCETPPEYTRLIEDSIKFPWGKIDIRAADAIDDVDPSDYRLAIFDEVHNYTSGKGWGKPLREFINSGCPVLALTGSVNDDLLQTFRSVDREFPEVKEYDHDEALNNGIIPDFEWSLDFVPIDRNESSTLSLLEETAELADRFTANGGCELQLNEETLTDIDSEVETIPDELYSSFDSARKLATALRRAGDEDAPLTEELDTLDTFASGLSNRQTHWWNLQAQIEFVEGIVAEAMEDNRPSLVLTRSYAEAQQVWKKLHSSDQVEPDSMIALSQGESGESHDETLASFDNKKTQQKVLIAPGDRIGTGVDIKTLEVGVNLARPGTGLSTTLIQRLGRLLRKSSAKNTVSFHHILGIPPQESLLPTDGPMFIDNTSGFFAQVKEPKTNSVMKLPSVTVDDKVVDSIIALEAAGANMPDDKSDRFKQAYLDAIREKPAAATEPVVQTTWYDQLVNDDPAEPTDTEQVDLESTSGFESKQVKDPVEHETKEIQDDTEQEPRSEKMTQQQEPGENITLDGVLLALIDTMISREDASYANKQEYLTAALESYLKPLIGGGDGSAITKRSSTREISVECDPILDALIEESIKTSHSETTHDQFVSAALLEQLGVDGDDEPVAIPQYERYEFVINQLVADSDTEFNSNAEIIETAVIESLETH